MTPQERKDFANTCEEAIFHPLVQQVIDEYRHNMRNDGVDLSSGTLPYYGLLKCLNAHDAGKPVIIVEGTDRPDPAP